MYPIDLNGLTRCNMELPSLENYKVISDDSRIADLKEVSPVIVRGSLEAKLSENQTSQFLTDSNVFTTLHLNEKK